MYKRISYFSIFTLIPFLLPAFAPPDRGLTNGENDMLWLVVKRELQLHPAARVSDIYKLTYQGEFGVGHLVTDREDVQAYLDSELQSMNKSIADSLLQPCDPDGVQYRLSLRAFLKLGVPSSNLANAMIESIRLTTGDSVRFVSKWTQVGKILSKYAPGLYRDEYETFTAEVRKLGYPPIHHSKEYSSLYKPAYRVLHRDAIRKYFPTAVIPVLE